jgi:multidrug efflux system outer membrane protein
MTHPSRLIIRVLLTLLCIAACARGAAFHAPPIARSARVGFDQRADSTRAFFDSLASARAAERPRGSDPAPGVRQRQTLGIPAWLEILDDSILTAMVRTATAQNRDVALARARIEESRALIGVARSSRLPAVGLTGSVGTNQVVVGASQAPAYDAWRGTADVAWDVDVWGRTRHGVEAAYADLRADEAAERATVLTLVSDVTLGYLQLLELDEEHDIALRTLASRRATLALAQERYARGVVSELDVRQFEAQLAVPSARLAQVVRQRAQQEHALNVLLAESPVTVRRGGSLVAATRTIIVPDSLPATLLDRRPDVEQSERAYAAAIARVGVAAAERLPPVSIAGFIGAQAVKPGEMFRAQANTYQLQTVVSIPLFTGGRRPAELAAAHARAQQAKTAYERTALIALREAADALAAVHTARDEVVSNETLEVALRRALELSDLRYRSGVANLLEVLDAQRGLFDAELTLSQSRFREVASAVQLYKALGGSWVRR